MKTPEEILYDHSGMLGEFNTSIIKAMVEYAKQSVETASFSSERLQEITESKLAEIQEAYELEQEHNIELVERISELEQSITHSKEAAQYLDKKTLLEENTSLRSYIEDLENTLGLRNRSNPDLIIDEEKPKSLFERWQNLEE